MRIAYVEDNATNLALVERVARMTKHVIVSFTEGEVAVVELSKQPFDLILMDVELAGEINGIQVVKKLREDGLKTPIVAVTAYAMMGDREKMLEAGCNDYLPKPLPINDFLALLNKYEALLTAPPPIAIPQPTDINDTAPKTSTTENTHSEATVKEDKLPETKTAEVPIPVVIDTSDTSAPKIEQPTDNKRTLTPTVLLPTLPDAASTITETAIKVVPPSPATSNATIIPTPHSETPSDNNAGNVASSAPTTMFIEKKTDVQADAIDAKTVSTAEKSDAPVDKIPETGRNDEIKS